MDNNVVSQQSKKNDLQSKERNLSTDTKDINKTPRYQQAYKIYGIGQVRENSLPSSSEKFTKEPLQKSIKNKMDLHAGKANQFLNAKSHSNGKLFNSPGGTVNGSNGMNSENFDNIGQMHSSGIDANKKAVYNLSKSTNNFHKRPYYMGNVKNSINSHLSNKDGNLINDSTNAKLDKNVMPSFYNHFLSCLHSLKFIKRNKEKMIDPDPKIMLRGIN